jgi:hypothetical protein
MEKPCIVYLLGRGLDFDALVEGTSCVLEGARVKRTDAFSLYYDPAAAPVFLILCACMLEIVAHLYRSFVSALYPSKSHKVTSILK